MNTTEPGAARELAAGHLTHFEDADDDLSMPLTLPKKPRRSRPRTQKPPTPSAPADTPAAKPEPAPEEGPQDHPGEAATQAREPASTPTKGTGDRVRPSNVHIPVRLLEPIEARCKSDGLSHGELIIVAIEAAYPRLRDLIHPAATSGGNLFASRRSRASRANDGPLTPLNYRLREGDYATLDQLVDEYGASSRGHLITAALTDYFNS